MDLKLNTGSVLCFFQLYYIYKTRLQREKTTTKIPSEIMILVLE
jgi:hypothetical protein